MLTFRLFYLCENIDFTSRYKINEIGTVIHKTSMNSDNFDEDFDDIFDQNIITSNDSNVLAEYNIKPLENYDELEPETAFTKYKECFT